MKYESEGGAVHGSRRILAAVSFLLVVFAVCIAAGVLAPIALGVPFGGIVVCVTPVVAILAGLTFGCWNWGAEGRDQRLPAILVSITAGVIAPIATLESLKAFDQSPYHILEWGADAFDPEVWRSAGEKGDVERRGRMVARLLLSKRLDGMRRPEVHALLGPPDGEPDFWRVGALLGFRIDPNCLRVTYDAAGRVQETNETNVGKGCWTHRERRPDHPTSASPAE
jgi:hypothetical protein